MLRSPRPRLLVIACVAAAVVAMPATALARTRTSVFAPFTAGGAPAIPTTDASDRGGNCGEPSRKALRDDAYLCQVGTTIHDPCFVSSHDHRTVLCPNPALTHGVTFREVVTLPAVRGRPAPSPKVTPWDVEVTDGTYCLRIGPKDGGFGLNDVFTHYQCSRHSYLWGSFDKRVQPWSILIAPDSARELHKRTRVLRAVS